MEMYLPALHGAPIFFGCDMQFVRKLVLKLHRVTFSPEDVVARRGEVDHAMTFIREGSLNVSISLTSETLSSLPPGSQFGQAALCLPFKWALRSRLSPICLGLAQLFPAARSIVSNTARSAQLFLCSSLN